MNLSKIMAATLEQFNEEVMKEFDRRIDHENYEKTGYKDLRGPNDSLLDPDRYPESPFEIDADSVKDFITQKLTTHKELILKMVREKAPKKKNIGSISEELFYICATCKGSSVQGECQCEGFDDGVQEFLNNLDTI